MSAKNFQPLITLLLLEKNRSKINMTVPQFPIWSGIIYDNPKVSKW